MNFLKSRKIIIRGINIDIFASFMKKAGTAELNAEAAAAKSPSYIQTKLSEFKNYVKLVLGDYRDVAKDTLVGCKKKPVKASIYGFTISSFVALYKTNPTYIDYTEHRKFYANELSTLGGAYNRKTEYYLTNIDKLENENLLEIKSFVFFSFILQRNFGKTIQTYEKQCAQLNNPSKYNVFSVPHKFIQFMGRIVDVGAVNRFYFLDKSFQDYDIDEQEWENKKIVS